MIKICLWNKWIWRINSPRNTVPNLRILRRKLQNFKFESGILNKIFELLQHKKQYFQKETDLECGFVFDMRITPMECYATSTGSYVGKVILPKWKRYCISIMVFMLVGIVNRWKYVVGYHFTGSSCKSTSVQQIIFQIINKAGQIDFRVNFISDMGSTNTDLWKLLGISSGKYNKVINKTIHPFNSNRFLYVIGDPSYFLKNLKQALLNIRCTTLLPPFFSEIRGFIVKN